MGRVMTERLEKLDQKGARWKMTRCRGRGAWPMIPGRAELCLTTWQATQTVSLDPIGGGAVLVAETVVC